MRRSTSVLLFVALLVSCTSGDGRGDQGARATRFRRPDFAPGSVLFLHGTSLRLFDAESGEEKELAKLGSADAVASPDGSLIAFVSSATPGEKDFVEDPALTLLEVATGDRRRLGPGLAPTFSPDGELLAYSQPIGARRCEGEVCAGKTRVMAGPPGEEARPLAPPARWVNLGWVGRRLIVVDQDDPTGVRLLGAASPQMRLSVNPSTMWGGSPSGDQVLLVSGNGAELRSLDQEGLGSESTLVALTGTLGQGAWSPDGEIVAAVLVGEAKGGIPETALTTIASGADVGRRLQEVPESDGAVGQVLWARDSRALVYARSAPPRDLNLQAVLCEGVPPGDCRPLFRWRRGVTLLHLY